MRWAAIAYEAGNAQAVMPPVVEDLSALIDDATRGRPGSERSMLRARRHRGTALDKLAASSWPHSRFVAGAVHSVIPGVAIYPQPIQRRLTSTVRPYDAF